MLKHPNRPGFEFVEPHGGQHIGVQCADNFRIQTSQQRYGREFRGDDCSAAATLLKRLSMIALEFFKEHGLARAANSVDKHAGHPNASRSGEQLLKATKASIANGIANPSVGTARAKNERYPEPGQWPDDRVHDGPGVTMIVYVPTPGQRLVTHPQASRDSQLPKLAEVIDDPVAIAQAEGGHTLEQTSNSSVPSSAMVSNLRFIRSKLRWRSSSGMPSKFRNGWKTVHFRFKERIRSPTARALPV